MINKLKKKLFNFKNIIYVITLILISYSTNADAANQNGTITYSNNDWLTPPVDPLNPDVVVDPGDIVSTAGMLRLDFIPKLNFGINRISDTNTSYYAYAQQFKSDTPVRANYVQVTDHRDIKTGWSLSVQQNGQFKNAEGEELIGSYLSFDNQWVSSTNDVSLAPTIQKDSIVINEMNTAYPIANADVGKGGNTWLISFGSSDDIHGEETTLEPLLNTDGTVLTSVEYDNKPIYMNRAISLTVPGKTKKMSGNYSTVLTWTISELS